MKVGFGSVALHVALQGVIKCPQEPLGWPGIAGSINPVVLVTNVYNYSHIYAG